MLEDLLSLSISLTYRMIYEMIDRPIKSILSSLQADIANVELTSVALILAVILPAGRRRSISFGISRGNILYRNWYREPTE